MNPTDISRTNSLRSTIPPLSRRAGGLLSVLLVLVLLYPIVNRRILLSAEVLQHLEQGKASLDRGQVAQAEQEWLKAQKIAPNNPTVLKWLGTLYFSQHRPQEARAAFHRLAKVAPEEEHILCQLAEAEMIQGGANLQEMALEDAVQAASVEPDCFRAQRVAAELMERKHDNKQTAAYLKQALRINSADIPLRIKLIGALIEQGDLVYATVLAKEMCERFPGLAMGYLLLGDLYERSPLGSPENKMCEQQLLLALQHDPMNGMAHAHLGRLYRQLKRYTESIKHLEAASLILHTPSVVLLDLYETYKAAGKEPQARRLRSLVMERRQQEQEMLMLGKQLTAEPGNPILQRRYREVLRLMGEEVSLPATSPTLETDSSLPLQSKVLP